MGVALEIRLRCLVSKREIMDFKLRDQIHDAKE